MSLWHVSSQVGQGDAEGVGEFVEGGVAGVVVAEFEAADGGFGDVREAGEVGLAEFGVLAVPGEGCPWLSAGGLHVCHGTQAVVGFARCASEWWRRS